jgi:hypothetical protein
LHIGYFHDSVEDKIFVSSLAMDTRTGKLVRSIQRRSSYLSFNHSRGKQMKTRQEIEEQTKALLDRVYRVLAYYGNSTTYDAPRTGGVLQGCPRGEPPSAQELTREARWTMDEIRRALGLEPEPWQTHDKPLIADQGVARSRVAGRRS